MKKLIALPLLFLLGVSVYGQADTMLKDLTIADTQDVKVTLFDSDDLFEIFLSFDITKYKREKMSDDYLDAKLRYVENINDTVTKKIKVRPRGNIRRSAICDFPPLMLNFQMKDPSDSKFAGINKLKFVTYCKLGFEDYILREYLVYKLYNVITDYSFRVRLFKINYINTAKEKKPIVQYGFAIEPIRHLEKRTKTQEIIYGGVTQRNLRPDMLDRAALFNYMIGNTDWSVPIGHNIQLLYQPGAPENEVNLPVPYDFDYAGIVNTDYAIPFESLPIQNTRQRLYMAVCRSDETFMNTVNEFVQKKDALYRVINDFPYLNPRSKKDMTSFLDGFFALINKRNTILSYLKTDCSWFERQANLRVR
ncbi:MAG: type II toxin-antitoxin system HipA family toxin [Bacteroidales bacterium]|nr:type II toxin-antitoxin system HipA family toxin [Bacteroidales bacterium]